MGTVITALVRFLGLQALSRLSHRLPLVWGWLLTVVLMVLANLAPLLSLGSGSWGVTDLLLFYAIENCLIVVTATVRLLTYAGAQPSAAASGRLPWLTGSGLGAAVFGMIAGIFTLVGTILGAVFNSFVGYQGSWQSWTTNVILLLLGHLGGLAVFWFGQEERRLVHGPLWLVLPPTPRVLGLHLMVILLPALGTYDGIPLVVQIVVAVKIAWDFVTLLIQLLVSRRAR